MGNSPIAVRLITLRGYHSLRRKLLTRVDWFAACTRGDDVLFAAFAPSIVRFGALELFSNLAWAAGKPYELFVARVDPIASGGLKGRNPGRRPVLCAYDGLVSRNTLKALGELVYEATPFQPTDEHIGAHAKFLYRIFVDPNATSYGWVYVGSHNVFAAAWGYGSYSGFLKCLNWEVGVLIVDDAKRQTFDDSIPFHRRYPLPTVPGRPARNLRSLEEDLSKVDESEMLQYEYFIVDFLQRQSRHDLHAAEERQFQAALELSRFSVAASENGQ